MEPDEQDVAKLLGNKGEARVQTGTSDWLMINRDAIENDLKLVQKTVKFIIHLF